MSEIVIYGMHASPFVRKALIAAAEKGIDAELEETSPFAPPDWFLEVNPARRIPVMRDRSVGTEGAEGTLPDSSAICAYLEKKKPDPALYPDPGARPTLDPPRFGAAETETAFLVDRFLAYLEGRGGAPWFAHMSFLRPYPPFCVPAPYNGLFDPADMPAPVRAHASRMMGYKLNLSLPLWTLSFKFDGRL